MRIPFSSESEIAENTPRVAAHLLAGGLIAYPTETVYGFGSALSPEAMERLRALKERPDDKPFLLLILDASGAPGLHWTDDAERLAREFWPGPLTLALHAQPGAYPDAVLAPNGTVAIRASPHAGVRALLGAIGAPLTSTSANAAGEPAATSADDVARALERLGWPDDLWLLDGGVLPPSAPSTVVDCSTEPARIVRAGAVPEAEILDLLERSE